MVARDTRPWFKRITNIGIAVTTAAGAAAPVLAGCGLLKAAGVCAAIAAAGVALGLYGAGRRTDQLRSEIRGEASPPK